MSNPAYDHTSSESILEFSLPLTGKTLRDFLTLDEQQAVVEDYKNKGKIGDLVERYYFKINPGYTSAPDFPEAGVELKTTAVLPYKKVKVGDPTYGRYRAKERLKLTTINYMRIANESWDKNSLFKKCETILLLASLYEAGVPMIDRKFIMKPLLWSLPEKDIEFIKNDWQTIVTKIREGRAHELSGSDTFYLEASTSGSGKFKNQPYSTERAKERSFSFKASYVTASLIRDAKFMKSLEPIMSAGDSPRDFEQVVIKRVLQYEGMHIAVIAKTLGVELSAAKQRLALLSYSMLSIKTNRAEEFVKAGIEIKTVNLTLSGTPSQDTSFPALSYMDIVTEEWDDSVLKQKIDSKILFMIFQKDADGEVRYVRSFFWCMPLEDRGEAKRVWTETKRRIETGAANDLPLKDFSSIAHVRNHGANSKPENHIPSPGNGMLPVKGFWLNAKYIKKQIEIAEVCTELSL